MEEEVKDMLRFYNREQKMDTVKEWYDGYLFGNAEVYNPWSVINYIAQIGNKHYAYLSYISFSSFRIINQKQLR